MKRANRPEIEGVLKALLVEVAPADDKFGNYKKPISTELRRRLRIRKDVFSRKLFQKLIRDAFDTHAYKRKVVNNMHATDIRQNENSV